MEESLKIKLCATYTNGIILLPASEGRAIHNHRELLSGETKRLAYASPKHCVASAKGGLMN